MKHRHKGNCRTACAVAMVLVITGTGANFARAGGFLESLSRPRVVYDSFKPSGVAPIPQLPPPPNANPPSTTPPPGYIAVNIDTFWCDGDDRAADRALTAAEIAASFATASQYLLSGSDLRVGEIRTRPIEWKAVWSTLSELEQSLIRGGPLLRYDATDEPSRMMVNILLPGVNTKNIVAVPTSEFTPNYISIYVCSAPDTGRFHGQLFFQIRDSSLSEKVSKSIEKIQGSYLGLKVIQGVEIVGSRSPDSSEVRYFYPDDQYLAGRIAADISDSTSLSVRPKYIEGYQERIRQGTLEAWITP
ncbi:hypothetical protein NKZ35_25355 [Sinorhizobium meliloti]|uniref:hypothetical protein n=1 Tax=Rhizobium meliloti TaxID=382 RepID=UPI003D658268